MTQLLSKSEGQQSCRKKKQPLLADRDGGICRGRHRKRDLESKKYIQVWKEEKNKMTVDRSEEKLGIHRLGWKKYDMRLKGKQIVGGKKVLVFQAKRLQFANHKLRLRFLCFGQNSALHNRSIPASQL